MAVLKTFILTLVLLMSVSTFARIAQQDDSALGDDLGFKLDQEESEIREIASEESQEVIDENLEDSERDVASENEKGEMSIKYWEY